MSSIQSATTAPVSNPSLIRAYVVDPLMKLINKIVDVFKSVYRYICSFFWASASLAHKKIVPLSPAETKFLAALTEADSQCHKGGGADFCGPIRKIQTSGGIFYAMPKNCSWEDLGLLRYHLLRDLGVVWEQHDSVTIYQVVGDSTSRLKETPLDVCGTVGTFLAEQGGPKILFWGLTPHEMDGSVAVNQLIDARKLGLDVTPIGYATDRGARVAIEEEGCKIPQQSMHRYFLEGVKEPTLVDPITNVLLCYQGGPASLGHIIRVASNNTEKTSVYGYTTEHAQGLFSAVGFVNALQDCVLRANPRYDASRLQGTFQELDELERVETKHGMLEDSLDQLSPAQIVNILTIEKNKYLQTHPLWEPGTPQQQQAEIQAQCDEQWQKLLDQSEGASVWRQVLLRTSIFFLPHQQQE